MKFIAAIFLTLSALALFTACATTDDDSMGDAAKAAQRARLMGKLADSPAFAHIGKPLAPKATMYNGATTAIVRQLESKGPAARAGIQLGDELLRLNGKKYFGAADFDRALKFAPRNSTITLKHGDAFRMIPIVLNDDKPRLGASFEPEAVPLRRQSSPYIAFMHLKDVTVYAQSSINDVKKELRVNFIVQSTRTFPTAQMNFLVVEKGQRTALGRGFESLDALGSTPRFFTKVFKKDGDLKGPLEVVLNVDKRHFQFEFQ